MDVVPEKCGGGGLQLPLVLRCFATHFFILIGRDITDAAMNSFAIIPTFYVLKEAILAVSKLSYCV